jgi:putative RecB family exonuclease
MGLSTYSHNSLTTFRSCPRQFKFQYIEKPELPRKVSADQYLGAAVHRVLANLYKLASNGVVLPIQKALDMYLSEWEGPEMALMSVPNENMAVDDYIRNGQRMIETYYDRYQPFNQGRLLGAEMRVHFQLPNTSFKLVAIIDRLWKRDDGVVEIIDYKTGSYLPQGGRDPMFLRQMGLYQLAVQDKYPDFGQIELAQYFLKMDEVIRYRVPPEEIDMLTEEIRTEILEILDATRLDNFPAQESTRCNYCDYFELCPAKRHRLILEKEQGADTEELTTMQTASELASKYIELDARVKALSAERDALKEDIRQAAEDLGLEKLSGDDGDVVVKTSRGEKFITKTIDAARFAELSSLARSWQLDEHFELNARSLMKDLYATKRLAPEQLEQLKDFVVEDFSIRITIRKRKDKEENGE